MTDSAYNCGMNDEPGLDKQKWDKREDSSVVQGFIEGVEVVIGVFFCFSEVYKQDKSVKERKKEKILNFKKINLRARLKTPLEEF